MNIGILGSGDVAQALGRGLARHKHDVLLGTRDVKKLADWQKETRQNVGSFRDAATFGEIIILATLGDGTLSAIEMADVKNFDGKLVLDATNPLDFSKGMPPSLTVGTTDSLGEQVQRKLPRAHVVKCFNTISNTQMIDPKFEEGTPPMFIAGNDAEAKRKTTDLLRSVGWPGAIDAGDIAGARWLEALVPLWVRVAERSGGTWRHGFRVVV